jgi:hypothetical protein
VTALDLWDISSANRITATDDAAEMREIIRALLHAGWSVDNLSLDGEGWEAAIVGGELVAWLEGRNITPQNGPSVR